MSGWLGPRDEWESHRPVPHRANRTSYYLNPDQGYGDGLYRTRSQGAQPRPVINVYNDVYNDSINRTENLPGAFPGGGGGAAYPNAMDYERGRRDQELVDGLRDIQLERSRSRARSRGRSDASPPDIYRYQIEQLERENRWRVEQERIKLEADLRRLKDDTRRKQHELDEDVERRHIIAAHDQKLHEEEERRKLEEQRIRDKIKREKEEEESREKAAYEKFLTKQREEKDKKEKEEKQKKAELEDAMRKRLAEKGFAGNQIEAIINDEKKKTTTSSLTVYQSNSTPVFAKVHRDYLSVETLRYYDIPYKWDEIDDNYIIILREMDKHGTNILFEHTKALREGRLMIEAPKKEKEYAFYRKRDRSKSRNREHKGEWKSFGILEYKK